MYTRVVNSAGPTVMYRGLLMTCCPGTCIFALKAITFMIYLGLYILLVAYLDSFVGIPAHLGQKEDNKLLTLHISF